MQKTYQFAISADSQTITGYFNNIPFHTVPTAANLIHNSLLAARLDQSYSINVVNEPLPFTQETRETMHLFSLLTGYLMLFMMITSMCFAMVYISAYYVMFYIRVSNSILYFEMKLRLDLLNFTKFLLFFLLGTKMQSKVVTVR